MQPESDQSSTPPTKGYGKRPLWQWVLIYIVLAIVVYGIGFIAYRYFNNSSSSSNGSSSSGLY